MGKKIESHYQWEVYRKAFESAMELFDVSKSFPSEERYSLTNQVRRSSRSVCANLAEAWRKRRYGAAFVSKLTDAEGEAGEAQTWIEFAVRCQYLDRTRGIELHQCYDEVLRMIVSMKRNSDMWVIGSKPR